MKPTYAALKSHHYSSEFYKAGYKSGDAFYREIGYELGDLVKQNGAYRNTCAARMSLALIKAGLSIHGRLKIKTGKYAGSAIEPGAKLLADQLARPGMLGAPHFIRRPSEAPAELKGKQGIIFFWKLGGSAVSHIDLIETSDSTLLCNSNCYFACKEIWFWPLK